MLLCYYVRNNAYQQIGLYDDDFNTGLPTCKCYWCLYTRKPCCRKETARCPKCSFRLKFANNTTSIRLAKLRKPHFGSPNMLAQNTMSHKSRIQRQSKSRVWSQWKSSEAISNHNVVLTVSTFDDIVSKKDLHISLGFQIFSGSQSYTPLPASHMHRSIFRNSLQ